MVICGIDAHKRTHTVVVIDERGHKVGEKTTTMTTSDDHLDLVRWAERFGPDRLWAVEDCRHLSRRLERDLLASGQAICRVPPRLMGQTRSQGRERGKSDPIDALAVARAAWTNPDLPTARLDGQARELRLLIDHREDLVAERTRMINRVRWHLHELDPTWDPVARSMNRFKTLTQITERLTTMTGLVARIAAELIERIRALTVTINTLEREITKIIQKVAPVLMARRGVGALTAAKIVGEVADIRRFKSDAAFARHNGTAPLPVWSGNRERHRLSRTGNRQLNAAIHRIAITQARTHPEAIAYLTKRLAVGATKTEALRSLKRRISDAVFRDLMTDATTASTCAATAA